MAQSFADELNLQDILAQQETAEQEEGSLAELDCESEKGVIKSALHNASSGIAHKICDSCDNTYENCRAAKNFFFDTPWSVCSSVFSEGKEICSSISNVGKEMFEGLKKFASLPSHCCKVGDEWLAKNDFHAQIAARDAKEAAF